MGIIFAVPGHIEKIKAGEKTQTRRAWNVTMDMHTDPATGQRRVTVNGRLKYRVGGWYAVQPGRGKKGVGWIVIKNMWVEKVRDYTFRKEPRIEIPGVAWGFAERFPISISDAQAEGGYGPSEYEVLWDSMHRDLDRRLVIEFKWVGEKK